MTKKVIIYCRVAVSNSPNFNFADYQKDICKRYAQKKGYVVVDVIDEQGVGTKINTGLRQAINRIKSGEAKALIATEPARLTRNASLFSQLKDELGSKLEFLSSADCKDPSERELRDWIYVALNEFYRRKLGERVKKAAAERAR